MKFFEKIPARADFAYQQLVGPHRVSGADMFNARPYFGLTLQKTIPFGCVRDAQGEIYAMVRSLLGPNGTPNPVSFVYQSTRVDGQTLRMDHSRMAAQGVTPRPALSLEGDTCRWRSRPEDSGARWEVAASGTGLHWIEEGLFELSGRLLGVGMQWYLPGVDWGTFYVSQAYDVSGLCEGREVKGVILIDQPYLVEGGAIHFAKDLMVNNKMHVIWWTFANAIKAGTPAGVRWTFTAYSNGQPFYELVNEQTARLDLGGDWRSNTTDPNWRVEIEGTPRIVCTFDLPPGDGHELDHVAALNAARSVAALPRIVAGPPGCRTILDIPAPRATSLAGTAA